MLLLVLCLCMIPHGLGFFYTKEALADKIISLPGSENLDITFNQFSGYLDIPGSKENSKHMHYWLVESMNSPIEDPLAFWTNGGPGCSGLIGFMTEQGSFRPNSDGTLSLNSYAWNQVANVVFIESPAGVGFSYSDQKEDHITGDNQTAIDNYNLIQAFLIRFPHFYNSSLYISSESYGGHYMPTLAKQIVDSNSAGMNPVLNFKGFAVGNPYTDIYSGTPAMLDTYWGHQLVSKISYDNYVTSCNGSVLFEGEKCTVAAFIVYDEVGDLNPYALDYPVCINDPSNMISRIRAQRIWLHNHMNSLRSEFVKKSYHVLSTESYQPCESNYAVTYLNRDDVKNAIHVINKTWEECSNTVDYNYNDSDVSTAPIYQYLINGGYKLNILVYSGDDDSVCATIGTQEWIWDLGYEVKGKPWQPYTFADQTAGFFTEWSNTKLGFLTIHGAGHEVPSYKPDVALDMWTRYLNGEFTSG